MNRSLEGINAAVAGIMIASTLYISRDISIMETNVVSITNLLVIVGTIVLLRFTKVFSPLIVLLCLALGYFL